jgi:hypothetical protein
MRFLEWPAPSPRCRWLKAAAQKLQGILSNFLGIVLAVACPGDCQHSAHQRCFVDGYPPISGHPNSSADSLTGNFLIYAGSFAAKEVLPCLTPLGQDCSLP